MDTKVENNVALEAAGAFEDFTTEKVSTIPFEQLTPGWHKVKVMLAIFTNDFMSGLRDPKMKPADQLPEWKDATVQLAVYFEGENHKGATRRFSRYGYYTLDELLVVKPEEAAKCTRMGEQGYAVYKDDLVRAISPDKTQKASLILNRMLTAAGVPEGTLGRNIPVALQERELKIEIGAKTYKDKMFLEVINFAGIDTPDIELARIPKPAGIITTMPAVADNDAH